MSTATATATYTKLKDGSWGVRMPGAAPKGHRAAISVTKKGGETKVEQIEVIWSGDGVCLCRILVSSRPSSSNRYSGSRELAACRRRGWDGRIGSSSYYSSGAFDEIDA